MVTFTIPILLSMKWVKMVTFTVVIIIYEVG